MNKNLVKYLKDNKCMKVNEIYDIFGIDFKDLLKQIENFNNVNFYYKLVLEDNVLYYNYTLGTFIDDRKTRLSILKHLYLSNFYKIEEFEIIFGRDKKTLYKDIQNIKVDLKERFIKSNNKIFYVQNILNRIDNDICEKIITYKNKDIKTFHENICYKLEDILGQKGLADEVLNIRYNSNTKYEEESKVLTSELIDNIEKYLKKKILKHKIKDVLLRHINRSYWRYKNMVFDNKIDTSIIIGRYDNYFTISTIVKMILKSHDLFYDEEEIMYIVLYFLNNEIYINKKIKIIYKRQSTKYLIINELKTYFTDFEVVENKISADFELTSSKELATSNNLYVKIPFDVYEIKKISKELKLKSKEIDIKKMYFNLQGLLKKSTTYEMFRNTISEEKKEYLRMDDYLKEDHIKILNREIDWKSAVYTITQILKKNFYIKENYEKDIISLIEDYNMQMIIKDGIALIHAPIGNNVYRTGYSFLLNKKKINFPLKKEVHLIILFCAISEIDLLLSLQDLNRVLYKCEVQDFLKIKTPREFINFIVKSQKISKF